MELIEKSSAGSKPRRGGSGVEGCIIDSKGLEAVIGSLLRRNIGDFRNYKRLSLQRRVTKRMKQLNISSYSEYVRILEADQSECLLLHSTLTVKVSEFFRDTQNFSLISEALKRKDSFKENGLRAWCCGCATGEEAYSLAILILESLPGEGTANSRIFATDVDAAALESARRGEYRPEYMVNVAGSLKERYFVPCEGNRMKVSEGLRRLIRFGTLDIVTGYAFSRIDIIFCRNLFIYFNKELQLDVFAKLHYALAPGGLLLLGKAEVIPNLYTSFYTRLGRSCIYRKRELLT